MQKKHQEAVVGIIKARRGNFASWKIYKLRFCPCFGGEGSGGEGMGRGLMCAMEGGCLGHAI